MKLTKNVVERVYPEDGTHIGTLTQIIDWGTSATKNGDVRWLELVFELPENLHVFNEAKGEQPMIVSAKFSRTFSERSNLGKAVKAMLGKFPDEDEFDINVLLGKNFQLNIETKESGEYMNTNIIGFMPMGKTDKRKFKPNGELIVVDLEEFDQDEFSKLPEWKRKKIQETPEYKAAQVASVPVETKKPAAKAGKVSAPPPTKKGKKGTALPF